MPRFFEIQRDVVAGQSRGCWLTIQIRYTRLLLIRFWNKKSDSQGIQIKLFAPRHDPDRGYRCTKFSIR